MVQTLLGLKSRPEPDDVADALAVAICHASIAPWRRREAGVLQQ
jgi:crossover junction endodeoxyribonuclease RuvC